MPLGTVQAPRSGRVTYCSSKGPVPLSARLEAAIAT